jgi:hypothetical protein
MATSAILHHTDGLGQQNTRTIYPHLCIRFTKGNDSNTENNADGSGTGKKAYPLIIEIIYPAKESCQAQVDLVIKTLGPSSWIYSVIRYKTHGMWV